MSKVKLTVSQVDLESKETEVYSKSTPPKRLEDDIREIYLDEGYDQKGADTISKKLVQQALADEKVMA